MKNPEKTEKTQDMQEKAKKFIEDLNKLKAQYKLDFTVQMEFPEYRVLPNEVQLALAVLSKHKIQYAFIFKDTEVKYGNNKS